MKRGVPFSPYQQAPTAHAVRGAADFLRTHDKMASLLPALTRIAALQKECSAALPGLFDACSVLQFDAGQLVLAVPNAAFAAKLKQQLPKLQLALVHRGWQVNAIRLKVQVVKIPAKSITSNKLLMPSQAVAALAELERALEASPRNAALKQALGTLVQRHRKEEKKAG